MKRGMKRGVCGLVSFWCHWLRPIAMLLYRHLGRRRSQPGNFIRLPSRKWWIFRGSQWGSARARVARRASRRAPPAGHRYFRVAHGRFSKRGAALFSGETFLGPLARWFLCENWLTSTDASNKKIHLPLLIPLLAVFIDRPCCLFSHLREILSCRVACLASRISRLTSPISHVLLSIPRLSSLISAPLVSSLSTLPISHPLSIITHASSLISHFSRTA